MAVQTHASQRSGRGQAWFARLAAVVGAVVGLGWFVICLRVLQGLDRAGFHWPFPLPIAIVATLLVFGVIWLPFLQLFLRAGFRWWSVLLLGLCPLAGVFMVASASAHWARSRSS